MRRTLCTSLLGIVCLAAPADAQQGPIEPAADVAHVVATLGEMAPVATRRDSIVALARAQIGRRYVFGGEDPHLGFDCSGLVAYVMRALGIAVPRTAAEQARIGWPIIRDTASLHPGDLLVFGEEMVEHIGIYVGEGRFVHASSVAGEVIESDVMRPPAPLIKPWIGVRRLGGGQADRR